MKKQILIILTTMVSNLAYTQPSLQDWQNVKGKEGCNSIPYQDLKEECEDNRPANYHYCKTSEAQMPRDPRKLNETIGVISQEITRQKGFQKEKEDRQKSPSLDDNEKRKLEDEIRQINDAIRGHESRIEDAKRKQTEERNAAKDALSDAERCKEVREYVVKIFDRVIDKAEDESDPQIKEIATPLIETWRASQKGHIQAATDINNRISTLKGYLEN